MDEKFLKNDGGLGLGLAIARMNTSLIGGTLTVQSDLDSGSTFMLTFPYEPFIHQS